MTKQYFRQVRHVSQWLTNWLKWYSTSPRKPRMAQFGDSFPYSLSAFLKRLCSLTRSIILQLLYHLIQFSSHTSWGLPNRRNVTLVTAIFIRRWNHFVIWLSNIEFFGRLRCKTAENFQMSWWVWEVAETKTLPDASHVTWGVELN